MVLRDCTKIIRGREGSEKGGGCVIFLLAEGRVHLFWRAGEGLILYVLGTFLWIVVSSYIIHQKDIFHLHHVSHAENDSLYQGNQTVIQVRIKTQMRSVWPKFADKLTLHQSSMVAHTLNSKQNDLFISFLL